MLVVEEAQKAQFIEFSEAWDNYMAQYEETAFKSLERLKEKQILELQEFQAKALKEAKLKVKNSRELLELRKKQQVLAKQKLYDDAEIIKRKADKLEEWENAKNEATMREIVEKKEAKFRQQQQLAVAAMLKRIQRDRSEQLKHREQDSERLIQRNKNVRNDLLARQSAEIKKTKDSIRRNFENSILEVRLTQSRMARD